MGTNKIIILILLISTFISCKNSNEETEMISKAEHEEIIKKYQQQKEALQTSNQNYIDKVGLVENTIDELKKITNYTTILRNNVNEGRGDMNQAEEIQSQIKALKDKLKDLNKQLSKKDAASKAAQAMIASLTEVIEAKDKEVNELKIEIQSKDKIINDQHNTINNQGVKIQEQQQEISIQNQKILNIQKNMWYQLGEELFEVVEELPSFENHLFKGKKKKKVITLRQFVLDKSAQCFKIAHELGHTQAAPKYNMIIAMH